MLWIAFIAKPVSLEQFAVILARHLTVAADALATRLDDVRHLRTGPLAAWCVRNKCVYTWPTNFNTLTASARSRGLTASLKQPVFQSKLYKSKISREAIILMICFT